MPGIKFTKYVVLWRERNTIAVHIMENKSVKLVIYLQYACAWFVILDYSYQLENNHTTPKLKLLLVHQKSKSILKFKNNFGKKPKLKLNFYTNTTLHVVHPCQSCEINVTCTYISC